MKFTTVNEKCKNHGVIRPCLLNPQIFSMERIWVDVLHAFFRVTDVAEGAIQAECIKNGTCNQFSQAVLDQCKFAWNPHQKTNEDRSETNIEFPSLGGTEKTKIIKNLRDFSTFIIFDDKDETAGDKNAREKSKKKNYKAEEKCEIWKQIFTLLDEIFGYLNCCHDPDPIPKAVKRNEKKKYFCKDIHPEINDVKDYNQKISTLKKLFIDMMGTESIKNYFHSLEIHVGDMITSEHNPFKGSIAVYSCSAQELKNRTQTIIHYRNSNQINVAHQIVKYELVKIWLNLHSNFAGEIRITKPKWKDWKHKLEDYFFSDDHPPDEEGSEDIMEEDEEDDEVT